MSKPVQKILIRAGHLVFTEVKYKRAKRTGEKRAKRKAPTCAEIMEMNKRYSELDLNIKVHHNFCPGDIHLVLTYAGEEPTLEEARKNLDKFKRELKKAYAKQGKECKWIEVTEYKNKRIHHHFLIKRIDLWEVEQIWSYGHVRPTYLDESGDYRRLTHYLIKETSKTYNQEGSMYRRRYHCSKTVTTPDAVVQEVSAEQLLEPKANKGYYIDKDSVYKGATPYTESPFIQYVQITVDEPARIRGKKLAWKKRHFPNTNNETQVGFDDIYSYGLSFPIEEA